MLTRSVLASLVLAAPLAAQADLSVGVRAGTLGLGLEAAKLLTPNIGARGAIYRTSYDLDRTESDIEYSIEATFHSLTALVDLYPSARGSFHLSAGIISSPPELDGVGQPTTGTYEINGTEYTAAEVGQLTATGRWKKTLPYVGLGWGTAANRGGGLGFFLDLGAGIGTPTVDLRATSSVPGSTLAQDVEAEERDLQEEVDKSLKVYPVVQIGLAIRF
jgi:hypothetical protein